MRIPARFKYGNKFLYEFPFYMISFSDFLVNEVDLNDEVVRLTDISSIDEQLEKNVSSL